MIETIGIHKNIPIEEYHSSKGISSSGISKILKCPKTYWYEYLSGQALKEDTKATLTGQLLHTLVLEPEKFSEYFYVMQDMDRRTKAGKEAYEQAMIDSQGKKLVSQKDFVEIELMASNVKDHPMFKKVFSTGNIEDSILWEDEETGALLRSRPDFYNDFLIIDLKTTEDASIDAFASSIFNYGYHRQGAMACDALTKLTGVQYDSVVQFVVEKKPPYLVAVYLLDSESLELGRKQYKRGAQIYKECLDKNEWPGYEEKLIEIRLPQWAFSKEERI